MADPLYDLFERLNNPRERTVEGQFAEGRAWAHERARQLCYYKLPAHLDWFNFYLTTVKQYSATSELRVSEGEARLIRESCEHVLAKCHERLIERLQFYADYSAHSSEITSTMVVLATALKGINDDSLATLQRLRTLLREEEKNGTPAIMGGKWLPIPAPTAMDWVNRSAQREKAETTTIKPSKQKLPKKPRKSSRKK